MILSNPPKWSPANDAEAYAMRALLSLDTSSGEINTESAFAALTSLFANAIAGAPPTCDVRHEWDSVQ